jgi:hypothetical protein
MVGERSPMISPWYPDGFRHHLLGCQPNHHVVMSHSSPWSKSPYREVSKVMGVLPNHRVMHGHDYDLVTWNPWWLGDPPRLKKPPCHNKKNISPFTAWACIPLSKWVLPPIRYGISPIMGWILGYRWIISHGLDSVWMLASLGLHCRHWRLVVVPGHCRSDPDPVDPAADHGRIMAQYGAPQWWGHVGL